MEVRADTLLLILLRFSNCDFFGVMDDRILFESAGALILLGIWK